MQASGSSTPPPLGSHIAALLADQEGLEERFRSAPSLLAIEEATREILGKKGALAKAHRELGAMQAQDRKTFGALLHEIRESLTKVAEESRGVLANKEREVAFAKDRLDLSQRLVERPELLRGHLHLVTQTRRALEDTFVSMGFVVEEGPEAESDWYNFTALNMPPAHPARAMFDTFYLDLGEPESVLLRTHTSPVQIHLMERAAKGKMVPIHAVMPGRCFRKETPDARHLAVFHQIEGLVIDRSVTFGDLGGTIEAFTNSYFGENIHSRLRPAFFPFTEPSAEFEITCTICQGKGCRTCSKTGWIELGGCGMVDPAVFDAVGIDRDEWSGFAFGFGIDRCAQMRHSISDMRALIENDVRFLEQF